MDNIGDWLYLLLIIGFALSGFLKKEKKGKKQAAPLPETVIPENTPAHTRVKKIKNSHHSVKKEQSFLDKKTLPYSPVKTHETENAIDAPLLVSENETANMKPDIQNIEEIRRAIIYSEILNRKY
ncbi:MAG: hypothetical protein PUB21_06500 [Bacteroidales bacterium]|nr:hypothetical protein [Bacteroidales bacterium]